MLTIALLGAGGYVGAYLLKNIRRVKKYKIIPVNRQNYEDLKKGSYDIVINAAMPAARYWAKKFPKDDFRETVEKTADIVYEWKYKKMVQISTISARSELNTVYGKHKAIAETLCKNEKNLILRLTATFDKSLTKGVLIDMIDKKEVFVDRKSRYSFSSLNFVTKWIANHLNERGLIEIGAKNSFSLEEIARALRLNVKFSGPRDIQEVKNPRDEFPDAKLVLDFMKKKIKSKR